MNWKKMVKIIGIAIGVYIVLRYMLPIVVPFLFGWILAYWLHPLVLKIEKKIKLKRGFVGGILMLVMIAILGTLFWWLGKMLVGQVKSAIENFEVFEHMALKFADGCCQSLENIIGISKEQSKMFLLNYYNKVQGEVSTRLPGQLLQFTLSSVKHMIVFCSALVIIFISGVLFIKDMEQIQEVIHKNAFLERCAHVFGRLGKAGGAYFRAQLIIMTIVSVVSSIGLFLLGNHYFLLVGILIGFLDALPMIGTGTVLIPWGILCMLQGNILRGVCFVVLYVVTDLIRQFMEPKLIGDRIGVNPIIILFSVYAGLFVYGVLGFLLGPLSVILIKEIYLDGEEENLKEMKET